MAGFVVNVDRWVLRPECLGESYVKLSIVKSPVRPWVRIMERRSFRVATSDMIEIHILPFDTKSERFYSRTFACTVVIDYKVYPCC